MWLRETETRPDQARLCSLRGCVPTLNFFCAQLNAICFNAIELECGIGQGEAQSGSSGIFGRLPRAPEPTERGVFWGRRSRTRNDGLRRCPILQLEESEDRHSCTLTASAALRSYPRRPILDERGALLRLQLSRPYAPLVRLLRGCPPPIIRGISTRRTSRILRLHGSRTSALVSTVLPVLNTASGTASDHHLLVVVV